MDVPDPAVPERASQHPTIPRVALQPIGLATARHLTAGRWISSRRREREPRVAGADLTLGPMSPARRRLVKLLADIGFGRIQDLHVRSSQPVVDPPPRIIRTIKLAGRDQRKTQTAGPTFAVRGLLVELMRHLDRLGDGVIHRISICHGLPNTVDLEERLRS